MARTFTCDGCGDSIVSGTLINSSIVCHPCLAEQDHEDTPSLQDSDPEGYGFVTNQNPWGQEGGY